MLLLFYNNCQFAHVNTVTYQLDVWENNLTLTLPIKYTTLTVNKLACRPAVCCTQMSALLISGTN